MSAMAAARWLGAALAVGCSAPSAAPPGPGAGGSASDAGPPDALLADGDEAAMSCAPGSAAPCYEGPPGTEGVGKCKAGVQVCSAEGTGFGPCEGQVLPVAESRATPADDDCDGLVNEVESSCLWSKRFGDGRDDRFVGSAVDGAGHILLAGTYYGSPDFGGGPLPAAKSDCYGLSGTCPSMFIAKLDGAGDHLWSKGFGTGALELDAVQFVHGIAVDPAGNVVVTGGVGGSIDFGGGTTSGNGDAFLAKYDPDGVHVWSKRFASPDGQSGLAVATDGTGEIVIAGRFKGEIDLGGGPLVSAGADDMFVARFDAAGVHLWSRRYGDEMTQFCLNGSCPVELQVAVDATGDVGLNGQFAGTIDFGGGELTSPQYYVEFIVKLDESGDHVFSRAYGDGTMSSSVGATLSLDPSGNLLVSGAYLGTADLGGGALPSSPRWNMFLARLTSGGDHVWSKGFVAEGPTASAAGGRPVVTADGSVEMLGAFEGTIDLGTGPLSAPAGAAFRAWFNASGDTIAVKLFPDVPDREAGVFMLDPTRHGVVSGVLMTTVDYGCGPMSNVGPSDTWDIYVAKLSP